MQNEALNLKITFILLFERVWRHYDVTNVEKESLHFRTENSGSGAKWAAKFENHINFMIWARMTSLWRHKRQNIKLSLTWRSKSADVVTFSREKLASIYPQ